MISHWLSQHQAITFKHTRREGNKLADLLANIGVDAKDGYFEGTIAGLDSRDHIDKVQEIVTQDKSQIKDMHPDAGVHHGIQ